MRRAVSSSAAASLCSFPRRPPSTPAWIAVAWLEGDGAEEVQERRADPTLRKCAATWLAARDLKPRTRSECRTLLDSHILPTLGDVRLSRLTTAQVRAWHASLAPDKPTRRAHAYSLLKSVMGTAVEDEHVASNPCWIGKAGTARTRHQPRPATLPELQVIVEAMPPRYRAMVLLAACVLRFFKQIDATVPRSLAVHVVLDNLSAHKAPEITKWLAHKDRRRWHLHFTPTSSSWTNLIERWFKELTDRRLRRGVFTSVRDLQDAIKLWAAHWNDDPKPFIWKATADDIIEKVRRGRATLTQQTNTKTDH